MDCEEELIRLKHTGGDLISHVNLYNVINKQGEGQLCLKLREKIK